ncbi:zinc-binding dehydrogenase [candidate division KSB3 bacterium]|uniref:Zinc-binding dehydrogenase n=1 Tax=candidate division KSB3 bacterium TaxID=2044937 RepID=A0A9D5Q5Q8_9BACT|nr:zinc-binding dehydrogenase [candidate division KSB3 bacterium]MBD3324885.1 zinc-binding dehydrogenase [candidate division KSB3 bacterium]
MKTSAAVLVETRTPLEVVELEIPKLQSGQVLVDIAFSGVCHTQLLECRGYRGNDPYLPHCLGHEGSGSVREVGSGVTKVKTGDQVILSWIKGSGANVPGTIYQWGERQVNAGGITTFSRQAVISENRLTVIPEPLSMQEAALLGCAVSTGLGTVFNTAQPSPGQSLAVFGSGGIGLCAVAGAAIAGCVPIIAIDIVQDKLNLARQMGATHVVDASRHDPVAEVNRLCAGGTDIAIEASGRPEVMLQAFSCVRNQGGIAVVIGNARYGEQLTIDPRLFNAGKQLRGTWGGDTVPERDFPRYCKLINAGKLRLDPLFPKTYPLHAINTALDDLEQGNVARPIIDMGLQ